MLLLFFSLKILSLILVLSFPYSSYNLCPRNRVSRVARHPCPAERAMTLHWTRVMQTLVTRLVLTLRIRRHRSHSPLYLPLGFCSAFCPKKLYLKPLSSCICSNEGFTSFLPQFYLSFKKLKTLLH